LIEIFIYRTKKQNKKKSHKKRIKTGKNIRIKTGLSVHITFNIETPLQNYSGKTQTPVSNNLVHEKLREFA